MRPSLCEDGTNIAIGTKFITEHGRKVLPWYNPAEGEAPSDWKEKWRKLRDRFEKLVDEGCRMECFLIQRRIPQSKAGRQEYPNVLQSRKKFLSCNGLWIEPSNLFTPSREPLMGLFPFNNVRGEPMLNSQNQPTAFRLGLFHQFIVCHEIELESESSFQKRSQLIELARDATNLIYQLPAEIACWLWKNVPSGFSKTENANESLWFDALFQISLRQPPGGPLFTRRYDWHDNGYIGLVGDGLFPLLPRFDGATSLDAPKAPKDEDYPMAYYAKLSDLARASVAGIDEILEHAGVTFKPGDRFGEWTLIGDKAVGAGGNGLVWRCQNSGGIIGAIKFFNREDVMRRFPDKPDILEKREKRFREETVFLTREARRSGILPLIDSYLMYPSFSKTGVLWFVMPWASPFPKLSGEANLYDLVSKFQIISTTLAELHAEEKWHRDIHPDNLFLHDGKPVIGDFGLVDFPEKKTITGEDERIGARNYVAPELREYADHGPADKADVYSLAKCLWVIATGKKVPPDHQLRLETKDLRISTYCPHKNSGALDILLEKSTEYDPQLRPTMKEFAIELTAWLNPPTTELLKNDFAALTKEYQDVFEIETRAKRNREELIDAAKATLFSFEPVMKQVADHLKACTQLEAYVGGAYDLQLYQFKDGFGATRLVSRDTRGVKVTIGGDFAVFLQSFVQVEALENDTIRIVAGHLIEGTHHGERFYSAGPFWKKESIAPCGSIHLTNESSSCQIELLNNLGPAIGAFAERAKKLLRPNKTTNPTDGGLIQVHHADSLSGLYFVNLIRERIIIGEYDSNN